MPNFEAVPLLTWTLPERPDNGNLLDAPQVFRLLTAKVRAGRKMMMTVVVLGGLGCAWFAIPGASVAWAVACGLLAAFAYYAFVRLGQKLHLAARMTSDPQRIFWIHPTMLRQQIGGRTTERSFITLHSRDAGTFEVAMPMDQLAAVAHWYRDQNPAVRIGALDDNPDAQGARQA